MKVIWLRQAMLMFCALAVSIGLPAMAAPQLTENQRRLLEETVDSKIPLNTIDPNTGRPLSRFEGPGLYALLGNALVWDIHDISGDGDHAPILLTPELLEKLEENPEQYRGRVFLIQGRLSGEPTTSIPDRPRALARGHQRLLDTQYGESLTELQIQFGSTSDPKHAHIYLPQRNVYTINPDIMALKVGSDITFAVRFYKTFYSSTILTNEQGEPLPSENDTDVYYAFVGGGFQTGKPSTGFADIPMYIAVPIMLVIALVGFGMVQVYFKKQFARQDFVTPAQRMAERREREREMPYLEEDPTAEGLPEDPIDALEVLNKYHAEGMDIEDDSLEEADDKIEQEERKT